MPNTISPDIKQYVIYFCYCYYYVMIVREELIFATLFESKKKFED